VAMVSMAQLLLTFLKVGALGFGGPFALLALLESEVVQKRHWLRPEEFAQSVAIGTLTPGPIFFAAAVHVGYRLRGFGGAALAAVACILPGFGAAVLFAALYLRVESLPAVVGAASGLAAGVTGLLLVLAVRQARSLARDWAGLSLAVLSFLALAALNLNPVWVIVIGALLGAVLYRDQTDGHGLTGRRV